MSKSSLRRSGKDDDLRIDATPKQLLHAVLRGGAPRKETPLVVNEKNVRKGTKSTKKVA